MEMRFKETAERFISDGGKLLPFHPFPSADQRDAYHALPQELKQELIILGEALFDAPYPSLSATDFMAFQRTGNRVNFEALYFVRRHMLNSFVTAECVEGEGRFLDRIIDGIFTICEESGWQLPAHNSYLRNAPSEILPDASRPVLDLFACETGAQLACIYYLLKSRLDQISPHICQRISQELDRRILRPYLTEHFWWMGDGDEPMCNWTPWCTQNVLLTAFLHGCPEETGIQILHKAAESCDLFLKDYGEDGCCDEGAQYFRRAGLCLDAACDLIDQVTGGAFAHLYQWEKIKNIAAYISNVHVRGRYYFNFADCSPVAGRAGVKEYLFGKHTGQTDLKLFAAKDYQAAGAEIYHDELYQLNLYYQLMNAFCYEEVIKMDTFSMPAPKDVYYPSTGLFIARSSSFSLAVKAGDNNDGHNHNDTGSITLYKCGQPVLVDIGVESYTQKTFSPQRYEIWTMQSGYHNLPTIDGLDQRDGAEYRATEVETSLTEDRAEISMELAEAYPFTEKGHTYRRRVVLDKSNDCVILTDTTNSQNVTLNFITYVEPILTEEGCFQVGLAELHFRGASLREIEILPITDKRLQTAWDHQLYRVRLCMTEHNFILDMK